MFRPLTKTALAFRSLRHYWRTNLAVIAGVAIAVSVLSGALVVGESVKASLRALAVSRLGKTDHLIASTGFFRAALADDLQRQEAFRRSYGSAVGLIAIDGLVTHGSNGRRASGVAIYGVDDRFWQFHGLTDRPTPGPREALLSLSLARELGAADGDGVLARLQQPSAIPASTLHGRRDDLGRTLRATVTSILPDERLGSFSLRPQQGDVKAIFLPLQRLQRDLDRQGKVNAVLVSERAGASEAASLVTLVDRVKTLEDGGLKLRVLDEPSASTPEARRPGIAIESDAGLIPETVERAADRIVQELGVQALPVFAYLAERVSMGDRHVAYSVVAGLDLDRARAHFYGSSSDTRRAGATMERPIWFNAWMAEALAAKVGEPVDVNYEVWEDGGGISPRTDRLRSPAFSR